MQESFTKMDSVRSVPGQHQGWLLAIDTSADRAGIALFDGENMHACSWPAQRAQTTQVPDRVHDLLQMVGVASADLAAVAVASGPGTFTGLRVGMSLAKGFAIGGRLPVIGVPTLAAAALPWSLARMHVAAVLPAGRGRVVWQCFAPAPLAPEEIGPPVNGTPEEFVAVLPNATVEAVVGELPRSLASAIEAAPVPVVVEPGLGSRIESVALLGWRRLLDGDVDDLTTLEPTYVHGASRVVRPVRDRSA